MVESFPYEMRAQAFARNSGVSIEAARALYADSLAFDLAQQADTVERYSAIREGRYAEHVDPPQPGEQTAEPTAEQQRIFDQLFKSYFSSPANCEQFSKYMAGDAVKDQPMTMTKDQMEAALKHQAANGGSFEDATKATQGPKGVPTYTANDFRTRLRAELPPMTKAEMNSALKYMAQTGATWDQASDVARGISPAADRERYAERSEDVRRSGSGEAGFSRVSTEIRQAREEMMAERREREGKIARIHETARNQGLPVNMCYQAMAMAESGESPSFEAAIETLKLRCRNLAEFNEQTPGVSITSLRPYGK